MIKRVRTDNEPELKFYKDVIKHLFNNVYMTSGVWNGKTMFFGLPVFQNPFDLWILQEIIFNTKPNVIIETGTSHGGSALYLALLYDNLASCTSLHGKVITIDIVGNKNRLQHPRITYLTGSSISSKILDDVKTIVKDTDNVMVILDSDHSKEFVKKELAEYCEFVSNGCYLVVCDTNLSVLSMPVVLPKFTSDIFKHADKFPMTAVLDFLQDNEDFMVDIECEKFGFTFNPNGFLKRVGTT